MQILRFTASALWTFIESGHKAAQQNLTQPKRLFFILLSKTGR